jgi:hypothetical protein
VQSQLKKEKHKTINKAPKGMGVFLNLLWQSYHWPLQTNSRQHDHSQECGDKQAPQALLAAHVQSAQDFELVLANS